MAYLYRTGSATANGGYSNLWTWSGWIKRSKLGNQGIFNNRKNGSNTASRFKLFFNSDDKIQWECKDSGGNDDSSFQTNRRFRDTNGYYHIVFIYNSDNGTAGDRLRLYVNGVRETSFASEDQAGSGFGTLWSSSMWHYIGVANDNSGLWSASAFEGYMSHVHFAYGTAYEPSVFGETDSTTGEWKIKADPTVTYGSQGYFMLKNDGSVSDDSGEGNNFQASGTITNAQDNPSNIFATLNPLVNNAGQMMALTQGNLTCESTTSSPAWKTAVSTLGISSGKYYWEIKCNNVHNAHSNGVMGSNVLVANTTNPMNQTGWTGFYNESSDGGEMRKDNAITSNNYGTFSNGDIMGVACDMDNHTISIYKNGSALVSNYALSTTGRDVVFPASCYYQTNGGVQSSYNFGNGYFGTTAVSSNSGNGYSATGSLGIFQYQPPTGYTALCTKGLNL